MVRRIRDQSRIETGVRIAMVAAGILGCSKSSSPPGDLDASVPGRQAAAEPVAAPDYGVRLGPAAGAAQPGPGAA
ncbi:MAG: hypothetical protein QME96_04055, partial [Myxococcota bacterium]|nr:hypothetical protein [Myxococcota bacterium]